MLHSFCVNHPFLVGLVDKFWESPSVYEPFWSLYFQVTIIFCKHSCSQCYLPVFSWDIFVLGCNVNYDNWLCNILDLLRPDCKEKKTTTQYLLRLSFYQKGYHKKSLEFMFFRYLLKIVRNKKPFVGDCFEHYHRINLMRKVRLKICCFQFWFFAVYRILHLHP